MSLAARIQSLFQERRRDPRERVLIAAYLRTGNEACRAVLLNLSRTGAMMASVSPPPIGSDTTLVCEDLEVRGAIAWSKGYQFGVTFTRRIDTAQVDAIVALAGGKGSGR